jgi:O-antigen/teichoic acid export membrane protein
MCSNLLILPYLISKLGTDLYGSWVLVLLISNLYTVFDLGIGQGIIKKVADSIAYGDIFAVNRVVNTATAFTLVCSTAVVIIGYFTMPMIAGIIFHIEEPLLTEILWSLRVGLVIFFVSSITNAMNSALYGAQKMGSVNILLIGTTVGSLLGAVLVVHFGLGLRGLVLNQLGWSVCSLIVTSLWTYSKINGLKSAPHFHLNVLREMMPYSVRLQAITLMAFIMEQLNKAFVGMLMNLHFVALFDITMKIVNIVRFPSMLLLSAIVPSAAELHTLQKGHLLEELYIRGQKYLALISVPVATISILAADLMMRLFLGHNFDAPVLFVRILIFSYSINLLTGIGTTIARGVGRPQLEMKYGIISAATNVILVFVLAQIFGYGGFTFGLSIAVITGSFYYAFGLAKNSKHILSFSAKVLPKGFGVIILPSFIILFLLSASSIISILSVFQGYGVLWLCVIYAGLYYYSLKQSRFLDERDYRYFMMAFEKGIVFLRKNI